MLIESIKTILFDCDGVVLNSNKIKTDVFFEVASEFGNESAQELVAYHLKNGGVSRYIKFNYFIENILQGSPEGLSVDILLNQYSKLVKERLMTCDINPNLKYLKERTREIPWAIVSGGDQAELREIFKVRGIEDLFNAGIYGSPRSKEEIVIEGLATKNFSNNSLFIGDSKYDFLVARKFNFKFIFFNKWTEVQDWKDFCNAESIYFIDDIDLLDIKI